MNKHEFEKIVFLNIFQPCTDFLNAKLQEFSSAEKLFFCMISNSARVLKNIIILYISTLV